MINIFLFLLDQLTRKWYNDIIFPVDSIIRFYKISIIISTKSQIDLAKLRRKKIS